MLEIRILAHRGASPEAILKAERGVASCGGGSQPLASGGPGPRPPGTTTWLRGARCTDPEGKCPPLHGGGRRRRRKRGPEAQNRHGGAPRGERPALWDARRLARRLAYRVISAFTRVCDAHDTPHGCPLAPERLSALRP